MLNKHALHPTLVSNVSGKKVSVELRDVRILMVVMMIFVMLRKKDVLVMELNAFCQDFVLRYKSKINALKVLMDHVYGMNLVVHSFSLVQAFKVI